MYSKNKKGGAEGSSNAERTSNAKRTSNALIMFPLQKSTNNKCHMIIPELFVSTKNIMHPNISDLIILGKNNTKQIDGWFMYILCWIKGERSIILLEGMVDDFKSKHIDIIAALKESKKFKETEIQYIISGEIHINNYKKEIEIDEDSGTFYLSEQYGNLKRKSGNILFNFSKVINFAQNLYEIETNTKLEKTEYKINCKENIRLKIQDVLKENVYKVKLLPRSFKEIESLKTITNNISYEYSLLNIFDDKIWQDNINLFIVPFVNSIFTGFNVTFKKKIEYSISNYTNNEIIERYKKRFCRGEPIYKYSKESECENETNSIGELCYSKSSKKRNSPSKSPNSSKKRNSPSKSPNSSKKRKSPKKKK